MLQNRLVVENKQEIISQIQIQTDNPEKILHLVQHEPWSMVDPVFQNQNPHFVIFRISILI